MCPERQKLPVIPLQSSVLFPGPTVPVSVRRPETLRAVDVATSGSEKIFAVAERDMREPGSGEGLYSIGTVAEIVQVQRGLAGIELLVTGVERAMALEYEKDDGFVRALLQPVESLKPLDREDAAFTALYREVRERSLEFGTQRGLPEDVLRNVLASVDDAGDLSDLVAAYLELPVPEKQQLLETRDVEQRLRAVLVKLQRQIELHKAQAEIQSKIQEELGERQKEMYLREQLKQIHKELGDRGPQAEVVALRERIADLDLPEEVLKEAQRELARLESASPESMDAQVIRNYLGWILELPWASRTDDDLDLDRAEKILNEDHYGLSDVKDRVLEFLAVRRLRTMPLEEQRAASRDSAAAAHDEEPAQPPGAEPSLDKARAVAHGPILLFLGPPGVGKTSIAQSIARALDRKYVRVALGGVRDEAEIRGHRRTYVGAMPGRILQGLKRAGSKNPVFLLDEIDKLGTSFQGDPAGALLEVLDPAQNNTFTDHYLNLPFDLSEVLFIATANLAHPIPPALLDRMESVEFAGYTVQEKAEIAERFLIRRQLAEAGLAGIDGTPMFTREAVVTLISRYTRESGVRQLELKIGAVARKLARQLASGRSIPVEITPDVVRELLGRPRVHPERAAEQDEVGVATGMYFSPTGGDIMFVEAAVRPLDGDAARTGGSALILTGQLGEVMRESARAALTYATTHAKALDIPDEKLGPVEAHVHVPAGAVPKDGPSAGITIATALASALSGRPVRSDLAMTGEVSLRGRVLPIGGVKEKVLGAHRAGIRIIVLPEQNRNDLEDLPEQVRNDLEFVLVESLSEVFRAALWPSERIAASNFEGRRRGGNGHAAMEPEGP